MFNNLTEYNTDLKKMNITYIASNLKLNLLIVQIAYELRYCQNNKTDELMNNNIIF